MAVLVISYSRADQPQVRAVVDLITATRYDIEDVVFWDAKFVAGELWFEQLQAAIMRTRTLFVFWCHHSSNSKQVRREYMYARAQNKRLVPVLLDDTPLVQELAEIHAVDLRTAFKHAPISIVRRVWRGLISWGGGSRRAPELPSPEEEQRQAREARIDAEKRTAAERRRRFAEEARAAAAQRADEPGAASSKPDTELTDTGTWVGGYVGSYADTELTDSGIWVGNYGVDSAFLPTFNRTRVIEQFAPFLDDDSASE
jgi:hypothetical protein